MQDFILPDIGEGIVECELLEWLVKEGDLIEEDQPVAEVMTDKATVQIPAMHSGKVSKLYYKAGEVAKVHEPLFALDGNLDDQQKAHGTSEGASSDKSKTSEPIFEEEESKLSHAPSADDADSSKVQSRETLDFILPDIGEGIVECEIVKWLVEEGEKVTEDQAVVEVMTDKALVEIPAKYSGVISQLYYQQGEVAKVHSPLYSLNTSEGCGTKIGLQKTAEQVSHQPQVTQQRSPEQKSINKKALASPAVRRLARENNLDITCVLGSGKKGRVLKQDIAAHLDKSQQTDSANQVATNHNVNENRRSQSQQTEGVDNHNTVEPIRGIKAIMAKQMTDSVFSIPHFSVSDEIEMDKLMEVRRELKQEFEGKGTKLSLMPFFIKSLSLALKQYPIINSQVNPECTEITYIKTHNIGIAVDSKVGLLVPNIKGVESLSLFEIAQEVERLVGLARQGKLSNQDLKGGTISISNVGVIGGTTATPVINKPESAIVALGKIQRLPRFDQNDNVVPVNIMHISWSGDHRIIDGATMLKFSNLWKSYLENPISMLTELS
ncbi:MAG: dihydrolipoyllysine-residue acetyltransferase [Aliiglaciecola sp.]|uniref:dihydrolipoyllysine-residue acetyltransferase n=1 Tax=Aliiglaciecola sp. TaxID=1872441 RepID=UPI003299ECAD